jgi:hypothetical protein
MRQILLNPPSRKYPSGFPHQKLPPGKEMEKFGLLGRTKTLS